MPIYDYECKSCRTTFDVFHKVREVQEDIVCPSCGSSEHIRLISAPTVHTHAQAGTPLPSSPACGDGTCCGGACSLD